MGQQSQEGHLALRNQNLVAGSYLDPGTAGATGGSDGSYPHLGIFMRTTGGAMSGNRELLVPDAEIGGNRDIPQANLGPIAFSGTYSGYVRPDSFMLLAHGALGTTSSTTDSTIGTDTYLGDPDAIVETHTITPTDVANDMPLFSVEEAVGASYEVFNHHDARVNTLSVEVDSEGYHMFEAELIAPSSVAGATRTPTPTFETGPLTTGTEVQINWNSTDVNAKTFNFEFANNIEDDDFFLGSVFLDDLTPKRREITAGFSIRDDNATEYWREATYGTTGTTAVPGVSVTAPLTATVTTTTNIGGSATTYAITYTFPVATIEPFSLNPSGDDVIENDFAIRIFRPDNSVAACTIDVTNAYHSVVWT